MENFIKSFEKPVDLLFMVIYNYNINKRKQKKGYKMKKAERIELGASSVAYCYEQGHDVLNLPAVLDMYKTYCLETCEKILERAKEIVAERS